MGSSFLDFDSFVGTSTRGHQSADLRPSPNVTPLRMPRCRSGQRRFSCIETGGSSIKELGDRRQSGLQVRNTGDTVSEMPTETISDYPQL
jgi:hypothetical protein